MPERRQRLLVAVAWPAARPDGSPPTGGFAADGWRAEPVLADQTALDRAGSRGRTPPPFQTLLWRELGPDDPLDDLVPGPVRAAADRWGALRVLEHPAWDDTDALETSPQVKQVSFLKARADLGPDGFVRHFRQHIAVARVHHPAICRYVQHDVLETIGDPSLEVQGVSELWFADEASLVERYFAGPDSLVAVRADNREYIDFSGTLSLLVQPVDPTAVSA